MLYQSKEWLALLAEIQANLECDFPRLVAADWLEEQGEYEHANFIRLQCELEKRPFFDQIRNNKYDASLIRPSSRAYEALRMHGEEIHLLWSPNKLGGPNWHWWCWAERRLKCGRPCKHNLTETSIVTPHLSLGLGEGSCGCSIYLTTGDKLEQRWRRGFVSEVRCSAWDWVGERCLRCLGFGAISDINAELLMGGSRPSRRNLERRGMIYDAKNRRHLCFECGAMGIIMCGPAITSASTINRVTFTDAEPYQHGDYWWWRQAGVNHQSDVGILPNTITRYFPAGSLFATKEEALDAASIAAISFANSRLSTQEYYSKRHAYWSEANA